MGGKSTKFFCAQIVLKNGRRKCTIAVLEFLQAPTVEKSSISLSTHLKNCLQDSELSWETFIDNTLHSIHSKQELALAIGELEEMERTGNWELGQRIH